MFAEVENGQSFDLSKNFPESVFPAFFHLIFCSKKLASDYFGYKLLEAWLRLQDGINDLKI